MSNRGASPSPVTERLSHRRPSFAWSAPFAAAVALTGALAGAAQAQHAETVLFGEPNAAGLALPAERVAVHPLTAPYYNEDAFVTSDLRFWYVNHQFPKVMQPHFCKFAACSGSVGLEGEVGAAGLPVVRDLDGESGGQS